MKILRVLGLFVVVAAMFSLSALGMGNKGDKVPPTEAKAFWEYITKTSPFTGWEMWPGKGKLYQGTEPHGSLLTTYVNKTAYDAITSKAGMLPPGSIVVKENFMPDKTLAAITVMYKVEGYNPEAGDWFWAKYLPDGKVEASEKVGMCIGCHGSMKANDYIMTAPLK